MLMGLLKQIDGNCKFVGILSDLIVACKNAVKSTVCFITLAGEAQIFMV